MAFDPTKPVQTRGDNLIPSRPVRILATDLPGNYPIGGLIEGFANLDRWTADGRMFAIASRSSHPIEVGAYDLVNIPGLVGDRTPDSEEERDLKLDEIVRRIEEGGGAT